MYLRVVPLQARRVHAVSRGSDGHAGEREAPQQRGPRARRLRAARAPAARPVRLDARGPRAARLGARGLGARHAEPDARPRVQRTGESKS